MSFLSSCESDFILKSNAILLKNTFTAYSKYRYSILPGRLKKNKTERNKFLRNKQWQKLLPETTTDNTL